MRVLKDERGDVILGGLARVVVGLLLVAAVLFELGAYAVNAVQLDSYAGRAARAAAAVAERGSAAAVQSAADAALADTGAVLREVRVTGEQVAVEVARTPAFVLLDRVPALRRQLRGRARAIAAVQP